MTHPPSRLFRQSDTLAARPCRIAATSFERRADALSRSLKPHLSRSLARSYRRRSRPKDSSDIHPPVRSPFREIRVRSCT